LFSEIRTVMNASAPAPLTLAAVHAARRRLAHGLRLTPCLPSAALSALAGADLRLKREDLQRTGSFKERGARHALLRLDAEARARGVVAASAGNHALGLAFHGAQLGVGVTVVMPVSAPEVKAARCRGLGAEVVRCGETFEAAEAEARARAARTGAMFVHPFDDADVIAGQGTVALEILEQAPDADTIVVPVGGGGLLAGVATVVKALRPQVRVVAVEPAHAATLVTACLHDRPATAPLRPTLADGLAVGRIGALAFAWATPLVDEVVTVTEAELARAMAEYARRAGAVVEGAAAAPLAAVLAGKVDGRTIVLPVTGRNVDVRRHAEVVASQSDGRCGGWARAA
jgi:threonine dehydratase